MSGRHRSVVHGLLDALADDVELALEARAHLGVAAPFDVLRRINRWTAAADEELREHRFDSDGARANGRMVGRNRTPAKQALTFFGDDRRDDLLNRLARTLVVGQEDEACAVLSRRRQRRRRDLAQERVGHLHQDACAVAGVDLAAAGATVLQVLQDLERLSDDVVRLAALDVHDEADPAGIALVGGVVQTLGRRLAERPGLGRL